MEIPKLTDLHAENLKKAESGDVSAWADAGYGYLYGMGVEADTEKALECFRKGARAGDKNACYAIYDTWDSGVSPVSREEAMANCVKAARLGHKKAAVILL